MDEEEEIYVYVLGWVRVGGMYVSRVRHIPPPPPLACMQSLFALLAVVSCRVSWILDRRSVAWAVATLISVRLYDLGLLFRPLSLFSSFFFFPCINTNLLRARGL